MVTMAHPTEAATTLEVGNIPAEEERHKGPISFEVSGLGIEPRRIEVDSCGFADVESPIREKYKFNGLNLRFIQGTSVIERWNRFSPGIPITVVVVGILWRIVAEDPGIDTQKKEKIQAILQQNFPNTPISFDGMERPEEEPKQIGGALVTARTIARHAHPLYVQKGGSLDRGNFTRMHSSKELKLYTPYKGEYKVTFSENGTLHQLSRLGKTLCGKISP